MSKRESLGRYVHIIKKLRKAPARYNDLANHLEVQGEIDGCQYNISKRTFQRDINDIRELYNIDIRFDYSRKVYFIDFDEGSEMDNRIFEAFDTFNALNVTDRLSDHIHFENRRPQGTGNLYGILHAIKNNLEIKFIYTKYWDDIDSPRTAQPFALKEFKNRWYLIGTDLKDNQIKSFGLDRLTELEITKKRFTPSPFDVNAHYKHCFGIVSPNAESPSEVVLSFNPFQGKYIKSLRLHFSQVDIIDNENELRVKLTVFITHDFIMEILSYGDNVKVIEPKELVDEVRKIYQDALSNYKE